MSKFSEDDIKKLAELSRLKLSKDEVKQYQAELSTILEYVERLQAVDIDGLDPTSQVTGLVNVMRPDTEIDYDTSPKQLLDIAPQTEEDQFKVPRMIN